jgi:hypothetical protein
MGQALGDPRIWTHGAEPQGCTHAVHVHDFSEPKPGVPVAR